MDENTAGYASMSWGAFTSGANTGIYFFSDGTNPDPAAPPTANSRVALINRIQFAFPNSAAPLAPTLMSPANGGWSFADGTLSWTSTLGGADAVSYDVYFGTSATPPLVSEEQTASSYTPTLAANTTYYWKVVATNEIGYSPASPTWSFKTPSATQLAESFENVTPFPPAGWANGTTGNWLRSTSYKVHGLASAYKSGSTTTQYTLSTPRLTITNGSTLDFWAAGSSITTANLQVVYSPDRVTWTQLGSDIAYAATYTFYHQVIDLSSLAGNDYYLGFRTGNAGSGSSYIDKVFGPEITPEAPGAPSLSVPADLATSVSEYPTFTWTAPTTGGIPTGYKLYVGTTNPPTNMVANQAATTYTYSSALVYETTYYWTVEAYNAAFTSPQATVRSFTTRANPTLNPPFIVDFGTVSADWPVLNWSQYGGAYPNASGTTALWFQDDWVNVTTPLNKSARMNIYSTARYGWFVSPPIAIPATGYELQFDLGLTDFASINPIEFPAGQLDDKFIVAISDSPNMSNPTTLREWNNSGSEFVYNGIPNTGTTVTIDLDAYTGTKYIAFYGESTVSVTGEDNDLFVDNVMVRETPVGAPEHVTLVSPENNATGLSPENTILNWTASLTGGTPALYGIYVGADRIDPAEDYYGDYYYESIDTFFDLSAQTDIDLAYSSTWYWAILPFNAENQSPNPSAAEFMVWNFTIIDDPAIVSLPHEENFDSVTAPTLPYGWSKQVTSPSSSYDVVTYTSTSPNSAPNHIRMYNSTATDELVLISPVIDPAINTLRIKFWAKSGSTALPLYVGTMSGQGTRADFTSFATINLTSTYTRYVVDFSTYAGTDNYIAFKHGVGGTYRYVYLDDVVFDLPATIPPEPASLVYPADGDYTLLNPTLKWAESATGEPATGFKVYMNTTGTFTEANLIYNGINTSFLSTTENGLRYFWKVVPYNTNGSSAACPTWSFYTPGAAQLAEGFEATGFPPAGWANGSSGSWLRSTSTPLFEGTASAYKYTSTSIVYVLSTPLLTINGSSTIDFYTRATATSQVLQMVYSTDRSTWTQIGADITYAATDIWYPISIDLGSLAGTNYYIGFQTPIQTATGSIYVDHVIGPNITPVTPDPVNQTAPADAAVNQGNRPTLTWTTPATGGVPEGFRILCDEINPPTTVVATASASPYTFTYDLTWGRTYYWSVVPYNTAGDASPNTVRSFTVMEDPTIYVTPGTPYLQTFGTVPPTGWSRYTGLYGSDLTTTTAGWISDDFLNLTTPTNTSARLNIYGTTIKYWLVTPPISIPAAGYQLKMDIGLTTYSGVQTAPTPGNQADDKFIVVISDSPTMTNPTILREWNNSGSSYVYDSISNLGENQAIDLSAYTGTKYIAFYGESTISGGDNNIYVDNLNILLPVANDMAATLVAGPGIGIAGDQLTYNVTVFNNGIAPQASYNVHLKKHGDERLASITITDPLAPGASAVHTINWIPAAAGIYSIVGEVELTGDLATGNNESAAISTSIYAAGTYMPMVGDIASTTTAYYTPLNMYFKNSMSETIYLAHEMQATAGTINAVIYQNNFSQNVTKPIKIWMRHTTEANLSTAFLPFTGYQLVFEGSVYFPMGVNAVVINLDTPFVYTGGNLAVRDYSAWENFWFTTSEKFYYTASPEYPSRTRYFNADQTSAFDPILLTDYLGAAFTGTLMSNIANTAFVMNPATPITSLDAPVATVTNTPTNVVLNWAAIPGAFGYRVYASDDPYTWSDTPIATVYTNTYSAALGTNAKKFYKIVAISYHHTDISLVIDPAAAIGFDNSKLKATPYIPQTYNKD